MTEAATHGEIEILRKRTNVVAENEVDDLLDAVVEQLGRVDYCANCAGTYVCERERSIEYR
jgi:NAD(P)-dependent dehydrogenase (short-subunit alcohol dehydrogenase family)